MFKVLVVEIRRACYDLDN